MPRARATVTDLRQVVADKYDMLKTKGDRGNLSWACAEPNLLLEAVAAVTGDGAALLLTTTSDGGALCLQVWTDSARHKLYPATEQEVHEALRMVIAAAS